MESNIGNTSDRDRAMMGSFEAGGAEKGETGKDKKKKTGETAAAPVFSVEKTDFAEPKAETQPVTSEVEEALAKFKAAAETPETAKDDDVSPEELSAAEKLDGEETRLVAEDYIAGRREELAAELADLPEGTAERAGAEADAALLDAMHDKLADEGIEAEDAIDEAFAETFAAAEAADNGESDGAGAESAPDSTEAADTESIEDVEDDEDDPAAATASTTSSTTTPPIPPVPPAAPPFVPVPPASPTPGGPGGPSGPGGPGSGYFGPGGPGAGPNYNTYQPTPNVVTQTTVVERDRYDTGDALLGGMIGYLIGKRRGRIKTERRLMPVQKKLETEVKDLHQQIEAKELAIRKLASERSNLPPAPARLVERPPVADMLPQITNENMPGPMAAAPERSRVFVDRTPERAVERTVNRREARASETIARVIIPKAEMLQPVADTLSTRELLEVAQNIQIEGVSVKTMFEQNRLTVDGVRRIAVEYLRGGDVAATLANERLGDETARERGHEVVDNKMPGSQQAAGGAHGAGTPGGMSGGSAIGNQAIHGALAGMPTNGRHGAGAADRGSGAGMAARSDKPSQKVTYGVIAFATILAVAFFLFYVLNR